MARGKGRAILRIALPGALVDGGRDDREAHHLRALAEHPASIERPPAGVTEVAVVHAAVATLASLTDASGDARRLWRLVRSQ